MGLCLPAFAPCWWMHLLLLLLLLLLLPSFTSSEPHFFFGLPTWTKDQKLSRNPQSFQCQIGTAETFSLVDCSATGFSTQMMYLHVIYSIISRLVIIVNTMCRICKSMLSCILWKSNEDKNICTYLQNHNIFFWMFSTQWWLTVWTQNHGHTEPALGMYICRLSSLINK